MCRETRPEAGPPLPELILSPTRRETPRSTEKATARRFPTGCRLMEVSASTTPAGGPVSEERFTRPTDPTAALTCRRRWQRPFTRTSPKEIRCSATSWREQNRQLPPTPAESRFRPSRPRPSRQKPSRPRPSRPRPSRQKPSRPRPSRRKPSRPRPSRRKRSQPRPSPAEASPPVRER